VLLALFLFGLSFGYIEATVVIYLRALYGPLHERFYPGRGPTELFPLVRLDQLRDAGPAPVRWLAAELAREAATLLLVAAAALTAASNFRQWFSAFLVAFGFWDLFYYVFLKVLLDWPESLLTWDLLFLLPVPWAGPVLAPGLVALSMIGAGTVLVHREHGGRPVCLRWPHWASLVAASGILVLTFCGDYRNLLAGGEPKPFNWPLFCLGEALGLLGFLHALMQGSRSRSIPTPDPVGGR
jgi:hypothetical protein